MEQEQLQQREHGATLLEELPTELKVAILTHLSGTELGRAVARVNREYRQLASTAVLQRAAERQTEVVALQRWWRAKREAALAFAVDERMEAIDIAIKTAERVIEPKLACLAARRPLLDLLLAHQQEDQMDQQGQHHASDAGKQRDQATEEQSEAAQPAAVVRFTRELVEAMLPEQLLLDLVAPFERFIADASAALLLWKDEHSRLTQAEAQQQVEDVPLAQSTARRRKKELQMFGPMLIRLLDDSMGPIVAYLTHLETEKINERIIMPLCQGADLDADAPYWAVMAQHFKLAHLFITLDSVPSFGVRPARQRSGAQAVGISPFSLIVCVGWGAVIEHLPMAFYPLEMYTIPPHPDRRNMEAMIALARLFYARLERTSAGLGSLRYD